jgi:hypothetical protein
MLFKFKLNKYGYHALASRHEAYGLIAEEVSELLAAIQNNTLKEVYAEAADIAVAAVYAMASIHIKGLDW